MTVPGYFYKLATFPGSYIRGSLVCFKQIRETRMPTWVYNGTMSVTKTD